MTVETKILSNVFSFHHCNNTTIATAMSSGIPKGACTNETSFRQYTTSIVIMACGSTLEINCMRIDTFVWFLSNKNGNNRIAKVTTPLVKRARKIYRLLIFFLLHL